MLSDTKEATPLASRNESTAAVLSLDDKTGCLGVELLVARPSPYPLLSPGVNGSCDSSLKR